MASHQIYILASCLLAVSLTSKAEELPSRIDLLFNDQSAPYSTQISEWSARGITLYVYNLDDVKRAERVFSQGLSVNPQAAGLMVQKRIKNPSAVQPIRDAWKGALAAKNFDITALPAIVFDRGESVIYGTTNLHQAIQRWQAWKERR